MCPEQTGSPSSGVSMVSVAFFSSLVIELWTSGPQPPSHAPKMTSAFPACITSSPSTACLKGARGQKSNAALECDAEFINSVPFPGDHHRGSGKLSDRPRSNHSAFVKPKTNGVRRM